MVLGPQLRRNVLAYMEDIIITNAIRKNHVADLAETFTNLRKANLSLNPEKCVFGVYKGKVLVCLVSTKGVEANPDKVKALHNMQEPQSIRDVHKLIGRIATLNKFIPRSAYRSLLFLRYFEAQTSLTGGGEQKEAFCNLKAYLSNMIKMTSPNPKRPTIIVYLSISNSCLRSSGPRKNY